MKKNAYADVGLNEKPCIFEKKCLFKFEDPIMCDCSEKENEEIGTKMKQWQRNEHETEELILWIEPGELDCTTKPWKTSWMRMAYGIRKKKKVPVQWNGNEGINDEIICTLRTDEVDRTLLWMNIRKEWRIEVAWPVFFKILLIYSLSLSELFQWNSGHFV